MAWVVTAYFTENTRYQEHAAKLIKSLKQFKLPYEVTPVKDFGDWYKGMQYKPTFLRSMLRKYSPHSIIYVDVDAIFCRYPIYFDYLDKKCPNTNIAVHVLDHSKFKRKHCAPELLSGTIFLRNSAETSIIVQEWLLTCKKDPKLWDQRALDSVLKNHSYDVLPEEYCTIFDYMQKVKDPVIKHFQASREFKRITPPKVKRKRKGPRVVNDNGQVKIGRIYK